MTTLRLMAGALATATLLAGCGNQASEPSASPLAIARMAAGQILSQAGSGRQAAAPARSSEDMAASALRANPGPLILAGLESMGTTQVLAMMGENGAMRTYMTASEQALILRGGMLVGTKGLGHDLSVAEAEPSAALIRAGRSGSARRTMRYITGDGLERPLPMDCTVGPGPKPGVMVEDCRAGRLAIQNSYLVQGGAIPVSRQWIGPDLGYVTIQVLRP